MTHDTHPTTRFGLLRHGKTVWNKEKRIQGNLDSPLTAEGIATCRHWAALLLEQKPGWNRLLFSPLPRARASAGIINQKLQLPMMEDEDLREQDWGEWEGLTLERIQASYRAELEHQIRQGRNFRPPGGESRAEVLARVETCLKRHAEAAPDENLLLITHLGVIKTVLYRILDREFLPDEPKIIWKDRLHIIRCRNTVLTIEQTDITLPPRP